jgi:hypothetical protein
MNRSRDGPTPALQTIKKRKLCLRQESNPDLWDRARNPELSSYPVP